MKRNLKLSVSTSLCLFGLSGIASQAQFTGPFSCYGFFLDDLDAEAAFSSTYDVLAIYRNINTGSALKAHYGWGQNFPDIGELTGLYADYVLELDSVTLTAQWDHSVTPRENWEPGYADTVIYF